MRVGSLASGYGGLDLAVCDVFGGTVAWHAEYDPAPSRVLAHHWADVPNLGDITAIDWAAVEPVDVLCGGYPCQPFSQAGKRRGAADERHIWPWIADAVRVLRPRVCVFENVAGHLGLGFADVLADLAGLGMDARWGLVRADEAGAPHRRERLWIVAWPADADRPGLEGRQRGGHGAGEWAAGAGGVAVLHTPRASDGAKGGPGQVNGRGVADSLPAIGALLPTPAVNDMGAGKTVEACTGQAKLGDIKHMDGFGQYAPAIARWEAVLDRAAPDPTEPTGKNNRARLSPRFVEWLMGLPPGWVTSPDIGLTYAQQLKCLGNGVVPQQAALALHLLLATEHQ